MVETLLLGAGASHAANVPMAVGMTRKIIEHFRSEPSLAKQSRVLSFVVGGLLFQQGQQGGNPMDTGVNVEDLFNAVQLLAGRHNLEAAPFVGSWHNMVEALDRKDISSRWNTGGIGRAILKAVSTEITNALPTRSPSFKESDIDRALLSCLNGGTSRTNSPDVGRKVGEFMRDYLGKTNRDSRRLEKQTGTAAD